MNTIYRLISTAIALSFILTLSAQQVGGSSISARTGYEQGHHADSVQPPEPAEPDNDGQGQHHKKHEMNIEYNII